MQSAPAREFSVQLKEFLHPFGVFASLEAVNRCAEHWEVLCRWNRVMNLVGDLTLESAIRRHYGESLFLASLIPVGVSSVIDVGSGAGFPGIGIAAWHESVRVLLVESRQKKAAFLSESTRGWANCRVHTGVADAVQIAADMVTSRAVAPDVVLGVARRLSCGLGLLVGSGDAAVLQESLADKGFVGNSHPVPWRPEASALVFSLPV